MFDELWVGATRTASLAAFSWLIGLPIGILLSFVALARVGSRRVLKAAAIFFTIVPFLATLFWVHYPLQVLLRVVWPPYATSLTLLATFVALNVGDILAHEMARTRAHLIEGAVVLGITRSLFTRRVAFPASLEATVPRLLTLAISSIHMTMFASLIGVEELFRIAQRINATILRPVEVFTIMAAAYAALCLPLYLVAAALERRLRKANGSA